MPGPSTPPANAAMAQSRSGQPTSSNRGRRTGSSDAQFELGPRVARALTCTAYERQSTDPVFRPLRIYALDPAASALDGAYSILNVPYEPTEIGPRGLRGSILEIVDEASHGSQPPATIDLNNRFLLLQQGRTQAPEDALFRQQMVYAVCMTTYAAFRKALGRDINWGFRNSNADGKGCRLRIRPAVPDLQNAFYDRSRGELSFGTFTAGGTVAGRNLPGGQIALCLSHDVVVHEMSHALLDGLRSHFLFPSNPDVLAFHEAFSDLIAIFQRFTYRDVVLAAMRKSRGNILAADLLTTIGVQFAQATSCTGALRSAVGGTKRRYEDTIEPHNRGELLVAAVFDAFTTVFVRRTAPLMRLATNGTGHLPPGAISELLAAELTESACRVASQFLTICIRAIDYCPPIDMTFGEFLRAVVTADADVVPHDELNYREAWITAFAAKRIYPRDVPSLSESALRWSAPERYLPPAPDLSFAKQQFDGDPGRPASAEEIVRQATAFGQLAAKGRYRAEFGLTSPEDPELCGDEVKPPVVQSIRTSRRVGPSGQVVFDLVAEITQRRIVKGKNGTPDFEFFGGATAILDPKGNVRFVVRKSVTDGDRLKRQSDFILKSEGKQYFGPGPNNTSLPEPKLLLRLHNITRPVSQISVSTRQKIRALADAPPTTVPETYLLRIGNSSSSISLLKTCINRSVTPSPNLDGSPDFDSDTERAVTRLQATHNITVDGVVGPTTWATLGAAINYNIGPAPIANDVPKWIQRLLTNDPKTATVSQVDPEAAFELYQFGYGPLSSSQHQGFTKLLAAMANDTDLTDLRWAAYMLATVKHECAETWLPIEEYGKGAGKPYGIPQTVQDTSGNSYTNTYYGRGYVQLTWIDNYRTMSQALGMTDALVLRPQLALETDTAYKVMSYGMRNGSFTGAELKTYINDQRKDYVNARRIINGTDQAACIAGYAQHLEIVLLASS